MTVDTLETSARRAEAAGYTVERCHYCGGWLWAPPHGDATAEFNAARAKGTMWVP